MQARRLLLLCATALTLALPGLAFAEYPERPIRLVVPYSPGGPADLLGRVVAHQLGQSLGQQVVIDNKPGAGLNIGADIVAHAAPDGYTLLLGASSMFVGLSGRSPADNLRELAPVSLVGSLPLVVVTSNTLPAQNVRELLALAKARPGQLNYGSSGNGSLTHMAGALFMQLTGAKLVHVPYRGINEALVDVSAGRVQLAFAGAPIALPLVKSGKFKALAVTGAQRSAIAPELPTVAESGLPGYDVTPWYGVMAPAGTPPDVVARLHREITKVLQSPEVQEKWKGWGADATLSKSPEEFGALMRAEAAKWERVVKGGGVKLD
jgi:tripartite-type tricarboxylate transporter receptor subunit TctC